MATTASPVRKIAQAASAALDKLAGAPAAAEPDSSSAPPPATVSTARANELRKVYRRAERRVDTAKEALAEAKAAIVAEMGPADVLQEAETGRPVAEIKTVSSLVFDQTRFRSEHPEQAAGYMKPQTSRRFSLA